MKKSKGLIVILILVCLGVFLLQCQQAAEKIGQEKTRIVVVHPNVWYVKSFIYLVEHKIIDIPDLKLMAVFYAETENEFDESIEFLEGNEHTYIHLEIIDGDLNPDNLYQENPCSDDFYRIFKDSDGILFLGGWDLPPAVYGQKTSLLTSIKYPHRHYFELSFLFHLLGGSQNEDFKAYLEENPNYVVNGFCLGMQTMNVATGGTMYQDIPSEIYGLKYVEDVLSLDKDQQHKNYWYALYADDDLIRTNFHRIQFVEDQFFTNELNLSVDEHPLVRSAHHQAVKELGKGFEVCATSMDGKIVEAIEHQKYKNVFGVQFHPEYFTLYSPEEKKHKFSPDDAEMVSEYEILQKTNSLQFYYKYWEYFGKLFQK